MSELFSILPKRFGHYELILRFTFAITRRCVTPNAFPTFVNSIVADWTWDHIIDYDLVCEFKVASVVANRKLTT